MPADLVGLLATILAPVIASLAAALGWYVSQPRRSPDVDITGNYSERLGAAMQQLVAESSRFDEVLREVTQLAIERERDVARASERVEALATQEAQTKARIDELSRVSVPAAEYFVEVVRQSEKNASRRDFALFLAGAVVTTIIAVVLRLAFGI
jgi:cytochrome c-type biogenesis protein CcmH/NrfG